MLSLLQRGLRGRWNFTNIVICSCNLCPSSHLPSLCLHTHSPLLSISAWWPLTFITPTLSLFALPLSVIICIGLMTFDLHHTYPLSVCAPTLLLSISAWWPLWPLFVLPLSVIIYIWLVTFDLHQTYPLSVCAPSLCDYLYRHVWPCPVGPGQFFLWKPFLHHEVSAVPSSSLTAHVSSFLCPPGIKTTCHICKTLQGDLTKGRLSDRRQYCTQLQFA